MYMQLGQNSLVLRASRQVNSRVKCHRARILSEYDAQFQAVYFLSTVTQQTQNPRPPRTNFVGRG